ncbi:hypothetical protein PVT67_03140 [Gallaecimonas kandeliae]|uniref:hypothetical protein n=1 Tax=Gallaecimonas kandeliae TaxID=3029055 RepID=UPI0026476C68|nr:hypothetical protein [Gallaecimonas kandeliae]WKE66259.1 hypothetical protein PVT67_03140 [Gallaecimonas kandeliae]
MEDRTTLFKGNATKLLDEELKKIKANLQDKSLTSPTHPMLNQQVLDAEADRKLKKSYANWFIGILICQLIMMNITFFCVGLGKLKFSEWSLNLYMGGTLAEVFGVILVITKNLFPKKSG